MKTLIHIIEYLSVLYVYLGMCGCTDAPVLYVYKIKMCKISMFIV